MNLSDMIYKRKSHRSYTDDLVDSETLAKINDFCKNAFTLYPNIKTSCEIVEREFVRCFFPWTAPHSLLIFSEERDGYLENAGFILQQADLYIQSLGLGACWLGMGRLNSNKIPVCKDGLNFVIMITFGYPKDDNALRNDISQFKRKALCDIGDKEDIRLEPARVAPSSVNSQPWYFVCGKGEFHAYCTLQGIFKSKALSGMNRIDMGICLSHMYMANKNSFRFFKANDAIQLKNHLYIGSFNI